MGPPTGAKPCAETLRHRRVTMENFILLLVSGECCEYETQKFGRTDREIGSTQPQEVPKREFLTRKDLPTTQQRESLRRADQWKVPFSLSRLGRGERRTQTSTLPSDCLYGKRQIFRVDQIGIHLFPILYAHTECSITHTLYL